MAMLNNQRVLTDVFLMNDLRCFHNIFSNELWAKISRHRSNVGKTIVKPSPLMAIFIGGMVTLPSHGWFMALFYPQILHVQLLNLNQYNT